MDKNLRLAAAAAAYEQVQKHKVTPGIPGWLKYEMNFMVRFYSENARVCAEWQWKARNCVTGLCDRRSRECNPVTTVECVSLPFCTHPCVLAFITYIFCTKRNWDGSWLMNLTKKVTHIYIFFKFAISSIVLPSLGETSHLKGCDMVTDVWRAVLLLSCYHCDSTRQHYDIMCGGRCCC